MPALGETSFSARRQRSIENLRAQPKEPRAEESLPTDGSTALVKSEVRVASLLFLRAYSKLILFELYLARNNFAALHNKVRSYPVNNKYPHVKTIEQICAAVDMASIWYWKEVRCLQRSAAAACLLRQFGTDAQLVIGARQVPFKAHAWVEVEGRVVNDKPYMRDLYSVLGEC